MNGLLQTGVYAIRCVVTGKRYVGSASSSFRKRWKEHQSQLRRGCHHSTLLQRAWVKYGEQNFVFEILELTEPEHAVAVEQTMIDYYRSSDSQFGFNISPTAGSPRGMKHTEQTKAKLRGRVISQEHRKAISDAHRGKTVSLETRQKLSEKAAQRTPEQIEKAAKCHRGKTRSDETRRRISEAKRNPSSETRARMSLAAKRRSADSIRKRAETRIKNNLARDEAGIPRKAQSPEHVRKRVESTQATKRSKAESRNAPRTI